MRFGPIAVDLDGREVSFGDEPRHLEPQAFDLLAYLVANRDRVVPKGELLDEVWGHQFVSESALTTRVKEIRRATGDDGRTQAVIRNVRGRGYRFVAVADTADPATGADTRRAPALRSPVRLVGREQEIAAGSRAIGQARLVTLVGPGGVGKTSLARHLAHTTERPDGTVFVDLAAIRDPDTVLAAVHQAIGFVSPVSSLASSVEALRSLDALLVLDNCEHLVATVADLVAAILADPGPLSILATSRERLGVAGEEVQVLRPLSLAAARSMFVAQAKRQHPDFEIDDGVATLDRLLGLIDHLPLAIEMAAGRLSAMGLGDLVALLDEGAGVLRSPNRLVAQRHRTLTDLVAWSEALLDPAERDLFASLSVFAGRVEIDDIVGVLSVDGADRLDMIDGLTSLVDRSLVAADLSTDPATYRLLETTKAHARSLPQATDLGRRHAEWFARAADLADRDLRTAREKSGNDRFRAIFDELRVAHRWARDHDVDLACHLTGYLTLYGHSRLRNEPARWAAELFDLLPQDHPLAGIVAAALAADALHRSDQDLVVRLLDRVDPDLDPRASIARLETIADLALYEGDLDTADRTSEMLASVGSETGDNHARMLGIVGRALALVYGGRPDEGLEVLRAAHPGGLAPTDQGWVAYTLAEALVGSDPGAGIASYGRAIELAESVDARFLLSVSRVSLAAAVARFGRADEATDAFRSILRGFHRDGNLTHSVTTMRNLVELFVRIERDEEAMTLLGAVSVGEATGTYGMEAERLAGARAAVEARVGTARTEAWLAAGHGRGILWALHFATDALDR